MVSRAALPLLLAAAVGCATPPAPPAPHTPARAVLLDGAQAGWQALLHPTGTTLVVFATLWCEACKREQPEVRRWAAEHPEGGVLYVISGSPADRVRAFVAERDLGAPNLQVVVDEDGQVAEAFAVSATPSLFLCQRNASCTGPQHAMDALPAAPPPAATATTAAGWVPVEDRAFELGTSYHVVVLAPPAGVAQARVALSEARRAVRGYEAQLSEWRPDSEVSRLNREGAAGPVPISADLHLILAGAHHIAAATGGAFDPTWPPIGALYDAAAAEGRWPEDAAVAAARAQVGFQHLILAPGTARFDAPGVQVGVAGVAKGFIIDRTFEALAGRGYRHLIVNIGGDIRTAGRDGQGGVRGFKLADPYQPRAVAAVLRLADTALATSGNYLRGRTIEGRRVGHIVDPRTGLPPAFDGSATAITRDAAMADALATALFVLGPEEGLRFACAHPGLDAVFVTKDAVLSTLPERTERPARPLRAACGAPAPR
jgi:thiamine biosynthesis lipoprotein